MKKITAVFFIAALILSTAFNYGLAQSDIITKSVIRLHIPANSNSEKDQEVKLKIRDKILEKYGGFLDRSENADQAETEIEKRLAQIEKDVNLWLYELGANYKSNVYISYSEFPRKNYGDITLPSGTYKALKVVLGKGKGENWWCVMFPPVCFVEGGIKKIGDAEYEKLKKELGKAAFELVTQSGEKMILKFKIVEIVNNIIG